MLNTRFIQLLLIFHFALATGCTPEAAEVSDVLTKEEKTNVVLVLIDDLSYLGVSAYGADRLSSNWGLFTNQKFSTPTLDGLTTDGLVCANSHAYPICENSRIALMSGKTNQRNLLKVKSQHASDVTFGDVFQREGYATGIFGKWKQTRGTKEIPGKDYIYEFGWDEFACFDVIGEGQRFINPNLVINGEIMDYNGRTDTDPATGRRWYGPDICNRYALDFIDRHKDEPFFLYYPMLLVHDDHKPTPDTKPESLFDNFDEANHNRDGHTGDDPRYLPDMIEYMDKLIGKVVAKLEEHGLRERTLIVVMGDNGTKEIFTHVWPAGEEYPGRKGGTADNGTHVPLIFSQPGTIQSTRSRPYREYTGIVDITDIFPTIAEATGIEIPRASELDGVSFWQQVMGKPEPHRDHVYSWWNGNDPVEKTDKLLRYAFDNDFKYYGPTEEFPEGRFFDLRSDSLEQAGDTFLERKWKVRLYSGLDLNHLTDEQEAAYQRLRNVIVRNEYIPVESVGLVQRDVEMSVGETQQLNHTLEPANATRNNVIYHSSDPLVAEVDKFGMVRGVKKGRAVVSLYSWEDAKPLATNLPVTFRRDGLSDSLVVTVR
ncbi:sulfatase-like hydrolase/transferase [Neolewinella aurantiaca]|uniref:Sulfatase-like hydrolase/transferase n=1 Tax=Neolewinella aurantiaca TaxID=2602767 RepID=A0A5C7FCV1_9BACT|nr:sulfatase-like hydrolase/transferase [Neolewinella aurantiaca]TXF87919.1 sulfatase-like hydrolase/transferase [Neolewinella aurantiaca]